MRIENADQQQLIVANEELASLEDVVRLMPTAQYLNVAFNSLTSLSGLEQMNKLRSLDISHNTVESLQEVATLSNLLVLRCSSNRVADLSWVEGLSLLEELWLRDNRIGSAQLAHLQKLTALQTLVIHPNPCTEGDDYILGILKVLPWLQRVDTVVVTEELRVNARHAEERVALDSGATDCSLFSLSDRSEDPSSSEEPTAPAMLVLLSNPVQQPMQLKKQMTAEEFMRSFPVQDFIPSNANEDLGATDRSLFSMSGRSADPVLSVNEEPAAPTMMPLPAPLAKPMRSKKQITAEDFMRAFPVQDFIPLATNENSTVVLVNHSAEEEIEVSELKTSHVLPDDDCTQSLKVLAGEKSGRNRSLDPLEEARSKSAGVSALLDSVLTLPTFDGDSFLKKKKLVPGYRKPKSRTKSKSEPLNELLPFRQDEEYSVVYAKSTVTAIQVRHDGSAIAKWPSGNVAVSVDFETSSERSGYRVYAAHKDGQLALSFDPAGVGFLNAYPSGKMLISTTSDGNGMMFDVNSGAIVRQWDTQGKLRDGAYQLIDALGEEADGSLLCRLSENLAVRIQLTNSRVGASESPGGGGKELSCQTTNPILLHVYFAAAPGIRHVFVNRANQAEPSGSEACDYALGKSSSNVDTTKGIKARKPPPVEHMDLVSSIRAAVAGL